MKILKIFKTIDRDRRDGIKTGGEIADMSESYSMSSFDWMGTAYTDNRVWRTGGQSRVST